MQEDEKRKTGRDLLKAAGLIVLVAAVAAAVVIGSQQLGIR